MTLTPTGATEVPAERSDQTPHPIATPAETPAQVPQPTETPAETTTQAPETPVTEASRTEERYLRVLCAQDIELQRAIRWFTARHERLGLDLDGPGAFAQIVGEPLWAFVLFMLDITPPSDIAERHAFALARYEALAERSGEIDKDELADGFLGPILRVLEGTDDAPVVPEETFARLTRVAGGVPECADAIILPSFLGEGVVTAAGESGSRAPEATASQQRPAPPCEHIDPSPGTIEFEGDFSPEQRARYAAEITREYESVACFFTTRFGLTAPPLTIQLAASDAPGAQGFAYGGGVIYLQQDRRPTTITEVRGGTVTAGADELGFVRIIAHEYVHALQIQLDNSWAPNWIHEGAAWYLDALHDQAIGRHDFFKSREYLWWLARGWSGSLRSMAEGPDWHAGVGFLAIERLVERAGEASLFDFYRQLAAVSDWQVAFENSFGLTADEFYRDFEAWRAEAVPPRSWFSGVVLGPDGNPARGVLIGALRSRPGSLASDTSDWVVPVGVSGGDGGFRTYAEPGLTVLVVRTDACGDVGFVDNEGGITRDRSTARQHVIELKGVSDIEVRLPRTPEDLCAPDDAYTWDPLDAIGWRR